MTHLQIFQKNNKEHILADYQSALIEFRIGSYSIDYKSKSFSAKSNLFFADKRNLLYWV